MHFMYRYCANEVCCTLTDLSDHVIYCGCSRCSLGARPLKIGKEGLVNGVGSMEVYTAEC